MENYYNLMKNTALFSNIETKDFPILLKCLDAAISSFDKNQTVFMAGNPANRVGFVLAGSVNIVRDDAMGVRTIIANCNRGDVFGESFAFAEAVLPISVITTRKANILFLNSVSIAETCANACSFHNTLIRNMVRIFAYKNIALTQKNEVLSARTIRKKLMTYFSILSSQKSSNIILVPFDRQGLADYLSVDRSAMSTEIGKMQSEGILSFSKNEFRLLKGMD